jgi:predicted DNA-binding protein (MmcQ/YjbR family)
MNIEEFRDYCLSKKGVTESFPFDEVTLVFKVHNKMYVLIPLKGWEKDEPSINLKCDPEYAIELREQYECINSGFHMSKKHWNTIFLETGELPPKLLKELIDHSYDMVVKGMTKKMRESLNKH